MLRPCCHRSQSPLGARLALPFPGVHIVEASKQVFRPITMRTRRLAAPRDALDPAARRRLQPGE